MSTPDRIRTAPGTTRDVRTHRPDDHHAGIGCALLLALTANALAATALLIALL